MFFGSFPCFLGAGLMVIFSLLDRFNCDNKYRKYLESLRWTNGVCCISCGDTAVTEIKGRGQ